MDGITLTAADLVVTRTPRDGTVVATEGSISVALDTELSEVLAVEGVARELVNRIQRLRKDSGLEITDRIRLAILGPDEIRSAADQYRDFISGETLAVELEVANADADIAGYEVESKVQIDDLEAVIALNRAGSADPSGTTSVAGTAD